ncbi:MAG: 8-oxo-dGTP diphosphatase [Patescibacteria group bacterium]|nr:8-oxo-dGTP diphosphatase [Patescibacteria group bacterium]
MKKVLTLAIIEQNGRLLLGLKKRGFGTDKWNGFGGKVTPGETIEEANRRECREECGLEIQGASKVGVCEFEFRGNPEIMEVHIFRVHEWSGMPLESEEMRPRWFGIEEIPFAEMWPDDAHWLPPLLAGKTFTGKFLYDENGTEIIEYEIAETDVLP